MADPSRINHSRLKQLNEELTLKLEWSQKSQQMQARHASERQQHAQAQIAYLQKELAAVRSGHLKSEESLSCERCSKLEQMLIMANDELKKSDVQKKLLAQKMENCERQINELHHRLEKTQKQMKKQAHREKNLKMELQQILLEKDNKISELKVQLADSRAAAQPSHVKHYQKLLEEKKMEIGLLNREKINLIDELKEAEDNERQLEQDSHMLRGKIKTLVDENQRLQQQVQRNQQMQKKGTQEDEKFLKCVFGYDQTVCQKPTGKSYEAGEQVKPFRDKQSQKMLLEKEKDIIALKKKLTQVAQQEENVHSQLRTFKHENDRLKCTVDDLTSELDDMSRKLAAVSQENISLKNAQKGQHEEILEQISKENSELKQLLSKLQKQNVCLQEQLEQYQAQISHMTCTIKALKEQQETMVCQNDQLEHYVDMLKKKNEMLQQRVHQMSAAGGQA